MTHLKKYCKTDPKKKAFTLVEILTVIAILGILAVILIRATGNLMEERAAIKARAEMNALAQALEVYKADFGDYPWIRDDAKQFARALLGERGPKTNAVLQDAKRGNIKRYIDLEKFNIKEGPRSSVDAILDPWGNPYRYYYKREITNEKGVYSGSWDAPGFILISAGPDGELGREPTNSGGMTTSRSMESAGFDDLIVGEPKYR